MLRVLFAGGNRFRNRMRRERLSGPPGLYRKSGKLYRSLQPVRQPPLAVNEIGIFYRIGGTAAYYAAHYESEGRLAFQSTWAEEAKKTVEELRNTLRVVRSTAGGLAGIVETAEAGIGAVTEAGAEVIAREAEWQKNRFAFGGKTSSRVIARRIVQRNKWEQKILEKAARKAKRIKRINRKVRGI